MTSWPCESFLPLWLTTSRFSTPEGGASAQRTRTLETAVHLRTPKAEAVGAGGERRRGRRQQGGGGREGGGRWRVKAVSGVLGTSRGAAGGTRCSLWGEKAVMGKESKGKRTKKRRAESPTACPGIPTRGPPTTFGTPRLEVALMRPWAQPKPQELSTHLPLLCHPRPHPFFFFTFTHLFFFFFNACTPDFSTDSALIRETKTLCDSATFWKTKGTLLITN